ncbi:MAG: cutinase [Mycobacterium sp.]|nr:cutinase [Mycobacterium sp.]
MVVTSLPVTAAVVIPDAAAAPCPDVEVVFGRGTNQPPGLGEVGEAFVDSLRAQAGGKSIGAYAVNYPASNDFPNSVPAGARDASTHVQSMAASCPNTRLVLGGYSQGATVTDVISGTMPPAVANHVAAVALFGNPKSAFADTLSSGPLPAISPRYVPKTIDLCVPDDPLCSDGKNFVAHILYVQTGMTNQAATFVASRV